MKKNTFSSRLKTLLDQKKLTLAEVAKAVNTSAPSVHRWTRGGEIEYENLRALAAFLNVNWIWLRYGDEAVEGVMDSISHHTVSDERREYLNKIMENEARMNLAQDMARIATWELNILINTLTGSANCEQIFGLPIDQVRANLLPFEALGLNALIDKFNSSELACEWDFEISQADKHEHRYFTSRAKLICDSLNRPIKIIGISIDITERKHMQNALEKNEYIMRKIIETIPVGLWIADQAGRITTANPEAKRIWGGAKFVDLDQYSEYKGWWESTGKAITGDDWTLARAINHREVSRGEIVNIEAFDGEQRTIIMSAIPLLDEYSVIIGAIEVNQDITALKNIEHSLNAQVQQWKFIFEQSLIGIAYFDSDNQKLHANTKFCEMTNYSKQALLNYKIEDLLEQNSLQQFQENIKKAIDGQSLEFSLQGKLKGQNNISTSMQLYVAYLTKPNKTFSVFVFCVGI